MLWFFFLTFTNQTSPFLTLCIQCHLELVVLWGHILHCCPPRQSKCPPVSFLLCVLTAFPSEDWVGRALNTLCSQLHSPSDCVPPSVAGRRRLLMPFLPCSLVSMYWFCRLLVFTVFNFYIGVCFVCMCHGEQVGIVEQPEETSSLVCRSVPMSPGAQRSPGLAAGAFTSQATPLVRVGFQFCF